MTERPANVAEFLLQGKQPSAVALRLVDGDYTYGDLDRSSSAIASYLSHLGASKQDRVLLIGENSFFWVASYLAIMRAGLVSVPCPPDLRPDELQYITDLTEASVICGESKILTKFPGIARGRHVIVDRPPGTVDCRSQVALPELKEDTATWNRTSIATNDLAALMFTSGSTGRPRGVMVSHANIIANTEGIIESLRLNENDSVMVVLPFHYCYGTSLLHTHLRAGGSLVIDSRFMFPEVILDRMVESGCTGFAGVPSHFQILLRRSSIRKRHFPRLRYVQQAGGRLAEPFLVELREALPSAQIFVMYGQTEATARLSYLRPALLDSKKGSIGKGIAGVDLRVVDEAGKPVNPGEVGEIVAEGQNVALGYWRAPDESAETFKEGKLHTGDMATIDSEGFIYIVDRARDFLKCRGERVSCQKLEEELLKFDELLEAAVVGIPDDVLGEAVKAFVVPRAPVSNLAERLRAFCKQRMASHFVPKQIVVLESLPKNAAGKIMKALLKRNADSEFYDSETR